MAKHEKNEDVTVAESTATPEEMAYNDEVATEAAAQADGADTATEAIPEVVAAGGKTQGSKKSKQSTDLIVQTAHEIENLTKTKALHLADNLAENSDMNDFRLGGVLQLILNHSWFDGYESFAAYVYEKFGFQERKARYLIQIYNDLVSKQIPWEKISHLGWTKIKDLSGLITLENVDEWVMKAEPLTVAELQALIKGNTAEGTNKSVSTKSDNFPWKVNLKEDQLDAVQKAIAKAKGELHTEYDSVALENISLWYLGESTKAAPLSLAEMAKKMGFKTVMAELGEVFPEYDIEVTDAKK